MPIQGPEKFKLQMLIKECADILINQDIKPVMIIGFQTTDTGIAMGMTMVGHLDDSTLHDIFVKMADEFKNHADQLLRKTYVTHLKK